MKPLQSSGEVRSHLWILTSTGVFFGIVCLIVNEPRWTKIVAGVMWVAVILIAGVRYCKTLLEEK